MCIIYTVYKIFIRNKTQVILFENEESRKAQLRSNDPDSPFQPGTKIRLNHDYVKTVTFADRDEAVAVTHKRGHYVMRVGGHDYRVTGRINPSNDYHVIDIDVGTVPVFSFCVLYTHSRYDC